VGLPLAAFALRVGGVAVFDLLLRFGVGKIEGFSLAPLLAVLAGEVLLRLDSHFVSSDPQS
jgi:hypothetical protein